MSEMFSAFWTRSGLEASAAQSCVGVVEDQYPRYEVRALAEQGYCSLTLLLTLNNTILPQVPRDSLTDDARFGKDEPPALIVQLRPHQHALDIEITSAAENVYRTLAPSIRPLALDLPAQIHVYEMSRMPGSPLSKLPPRLQSITPATRARQATLIADLAKFIAKPWPGAFCSSTTTRTIRADSPMCDTPVFFPQCSGKVGSSITSRLENLATQLPDEWLRDRAAETLKGVQSVVDWPVVLTHGDLIPSNLLVDEDTWKITGVVDWAEAEFLPFGICLYSLEHVVGFMTPSLAGRAGRFSYYDNAPLLKTRFWECMEEEIPEMKNRMEDFMIWRDVGVLLWHGIAWDEGKIDRVVNEVDDVDELVKLRAFLGAPISHQ